jgi:hypothetical protein
MNYIAIITFFIGGYLGWRLQRAYDMYQAGLPLIDAALKQGDAK